MMHEDFERLMKLFTQADEGLEVSLEKTIAEAVALFDNIKTSLATATPEEKLRLMEELNQMHATLAKETKKVTDKAGMTEEEILAGVENPQLYTPSQWESLQEAKQQLFKSGNVIKKMIQPAEPQAPGKQEGKKVHKTRREDWLKS